MTGRPCERGPDQQGGDPEQGRAACRASSSTSRRAVPGPAGPPGARPTPSTSSGTNKNLFYDAYKRTASYFDNTELAASGPAAGRRADAARAVPRQAAARGVRARSTEPPATDGSGNIRDGLREASALLKEAGWRSRAAGWSTTRPASRSSSRSCSLSPTFERIVLPFAKNLERLGIKAHVRTVDASQYQKRLDDFDFDMITGSLRPDAVAGQRAARLLGQRRGRQPGSRNLIGIKDPAIDALVEQSSTPDPPRGPDRRLPRARPRAAVGPLRHPALAHRVTPRRLLGQVRPSGDRAALRRRPVRLVGRPGEAAEIAEARAGAGRDGQLSAAPMLAYIAAPPAADGPDPVRHHADQFRHRPGGAGRAGRADDRRAVGPRRRCHRADHRRRQRTRRAAAAASRPAAHRPLSRRARARSRSSSRSSSGSSASTSRPAERFLMMMRNYLRFDFGESFFTRPPVVDLVVDKMPVSISLGFWTTLITYLISIPLGIRKAVRDGSRSTSGPAASIIVGYAIPSLPVRRAADRAVRRRQLLADLSPCAASSRKLRSLAWTRSPRLSLAHGPADDAPW